MVPCCWKFFYSNFRIMTLVSFAIFPKLGGQITDSLLSGPHFLSFIYCFRQALNLTTNSLYLSWNPSLDMLSQSWNHVLSTYFYWKSTFVFHKTKLLDSVNSSTQKICDIITASSVHIKFQSYFLPHFWGSLVKWCELPKIHCINACTMLKTKVTDR